MVIVFAHFAYWHSWMLRTGFSGIKIGCLNMAILLSKDREHFHINRGTRKIYRDGGGKNLFQLKKSGWL